MELEISNKYLENFQNSKFTLEAFSRNCYKGQFPKDNEIYSEVLHGCFNKVTV